MVTLTAPAFLTDTTTNIVTVVGQTASSTICMDEALATVTVNKPPAEPKKKKSSKKKN